MKTDYELAILILSMTLFAIVQGTHSALQILSYSSSDRNGDDDGERTYVDHLLEHPVTTIFSLGLARVLSIAMVLVSGYRYAGDALLDGGRAGVGIFLFLTASLLLPLMLANLVALRAPERFVVACRLVTYPLIYILRPVTAPVIALLRRFTPRFLEALAAPMLPLKKRIELFGYKNGGDEEVDEQSLMESVFDFGDTKAREVMVPRIDMVAVNQHMDPEEALEVVVESGHSRVPVYDESIDKIVGVVHTKDLLERAVRREEISLSQVMRDVFFVPEAKKIDDLLSEFKERKIHAAIVVDEYGGTAGLITMEDILEELVGDIQDEFDSEEALIRRIDNDSAVCSSRAHLDDLSEELGLELSADGVDTLGGFVYENIGRVPRVGEVVRHDGLEFRIQSVVRQRIGNVLIKGLSTLSGKGEDNAPR